MKISGTFEKSTIVGPYKKLLRILLIVFLVDLWFSEPVYSDQSGTVGIPIFAGIALLLYDGDISRENRHSTTYKGVFSASFGRLGFQFGYSLLKDFQFVYEYGYGYRPTIEGDFNIHQTNLRYYFWKKFFFESGLFLAEHREQFLYRNQESKERFSFWSSDYRTFGINSRFGIESQFKYVVFGVGLTYYAMLTQHKIRDISVRLPGYGLEELSSSNKERYSGRIEGSVYLGFAI